MLSQRNNNYIVWQLIYYIKEIIKALMIGSIFRNVLYTCKRKSLVEPRQDYLNQQGWLTAEWGVTGSISRTGPILTGS